MPTTSNTHPDAIRTYTLTFTGQLDADFVAAYCPAETTLIIKGQTLVLSNLRVDQSGLLGILRSLHNLGCVLVSLSTHRGETS